MPCLYRELREFIEVGRNIGPLRRQHLDDCFKGKYWSEFLMKGVTEGGQESSYYKISGSIPLKETCLIKPAVGTMVARASLPQGV